MTERTIYGKTYLHVTPIQKGRCVGCAFEYEKYHTHCLPMNKDNQDHGTNYECFHAYWIENTDEAKAAHVAARLGAE